MMNKYILLTAVAGVALGSYAAYAGNSATMTVTATIAHDVSLSVTHDLNMGTVTVNPAGFAEGGQIYIAPNGTFYSKTDNIISYSGFSIGTFTANVPDSCKVDGVAFDNGGTIHPCFRAPADFALGNNYISEPYIIYNSGNEFSFMYDFFWLGDDGVIPQSGTFEDDITVEYIL